ncbi:hypothetical protein [Gorillibacterium sp. sgz500922]|uniref:hypothetical protein n=1 Tax=Gorillibacterium sp. sgz500922 TaxID=3446694 RepID=UPI003F66C89E
MSKFFAGLLLTAALLLACPASLALAGPPARIATPISAAAASAPSPTAAAAASAPSPTAAASPTHAPAQPTAAVPPSTATPSGKPTASVPPSAVPDAELFDVKREQVIRLIPADSRLRQEADRWLSAASGKAGELAFEPHKGIGLRIALVPPAVVDRDWYRGPVRELFLFAEDAKGPHRLLFFDDDSRMHLIVLPYDLTAFLRDYRIAVAGSEQAE